MVVKREENRKKTGHVLVWNQDQLEAAQPKSANVLRRFRSYLCVY